MLIDNASNTYSVSNELKYYIEVATQKHMLYKQFVAYNCNGCSIAPLTDYANNLIYQELLIKKKYFSHADERLYADLRDSKGYIGELQKLRWEGSKIVLKVNFKAALPKKVRLKVWGYLQGKCLYLLTKPRLKKQKIQALKAKM